MALGIILGVILVNFSPFQFEWKFNVIDFLGLLFSFVILFYLQNAVSHRFADHRVEKDILIGATNKVAARLEKIHELCRASADEETFITVPGPVLGQFKDLNKELRSLEMLLKLTPIRLDMDAFREIRRECLKIKRVATGGGFPHRNLTAPENTEVQKKIDAAQTLIFRLIFYLNRL